MQSAEFRVQSENRKRPFFVLFVPFVGRAVALLSVSAVLSGCAGAPAQKTSVAVQPDAKADATLKDVQAQVVKLTQQNEQMTNTLTKAVQTTDAFQNKIGGEVASLTQQQFRIGQWVAAASRLYRLRFLGPGPVEDLVLSTATAPWYAEIVCLVLILGLTFGAPYLVLAHRLP